MIQSKLCDLLGITYPVFQGGMAWIADGKLAAAVSNAGGLGIISAMNADAEYLRGQIKIARELTDKPFGVNIMLMSPHVAEVAKVVVEEKVAVVTTGAGSPAAYMESWLAAGIKVIPVIASVAMDLGIKVSIMGADTRNIDGKAFGTMLISLPEELSERRRVLDYLNEFEGVTAEEVR